MAMDIELVNDIQSAEQLEQEGKLEQAAKLYEAAIRKSPLDEHPYNRLMIIYRKIKRPKDELRVIKKGISVFESRLRRTSKNKKLSDLSNKMMKLAGLANSKGIPTYHPEPINRWMKRLDVVEKKLKG